MTTREEIARVAREWVGTPYQHQQKLKQVGVDCVGVILGVGAETGALQLDDYFESNGEWHNYSRTPNPRALLQFCVRYLHQVPKAQAKLGDIYVFAWRKNMPQHFGIITRDDPRYFVHARSEVGVCVEHGYVDQWPAHTVAAFTWKEFAGDYS